MIADDGGDMQMTDWGAHAAQILRSVDQIADDLLHGHGETTERTFPSQTVQLFLSDYRPTAHLAGC